MGMTALTKTVQAHIPFRLLMTEELRTIIEDRINPEISFSSTDLETVPKTAFSAVARAVSEAGLRVTFHAPFMDLRPGAIDPKIRQATRERLQQVFDLVPFFRPLTVVCHPSFDERYYVSTGQAWLEKSIETWTYFLEVVKESKTVIALENVYETEPAPLVALFQALASPRFGFCFDTGHFNVFSRIPLVDWIEKLGPLVVELHLHDNNGSADDHAPVGKGNFPFSELFSRLRERNLHPLLTLEAHSLPHLWESLAAMEKMELPVGTNGRGLE